MASLSQVIKKERLGLVAHSAVVITTTTENVAHTVTSETVLYGGLKTTTTENVAHTITSETVFYSNFLSQNIENVAHSITSETVLYGGLKTTTTENVAHTITSEVIAYGYTTNEYLSRVNYWFVLKSLLPRGIESLIDSYNFKWSLILDGRTLKRADSRIIKLLLEMFPDTAVELLNQWERITRDVVGLSTTATDIIYKALALGKIKDRQDQVVARLTAEGSIKSDFFISLGTAFDYDIDITEFFPTMVNKAVVNDRLLTEHSQWYWRVRIHDTINEAIELERLITEMKPAHTIVYFTYPKTDKTGKTWHLVNTLSTVAPNFFVEYAGHVYTHNNTQMIRSRDGLTWENFSVAFSNVPTCSCVFKERLYVGTQTDKKIWKIISNIDNAVEDDKKTYFTNVYTAGYNPTTLEVFNNRLYLGVLDSSIHYRTSNGIDWESLTSVRTGDITSLREFDEKLYAGTDTVGIVYVSENGLTWSTAYDSAALNVQTLEVYNDYIYAASEDYSSIWRSSDGSSWTEINISYNVNHLFLFDEQIYAACSGGVLLRSSSGTVWNVVETVTSGELLTKLGTLGSKMLRIKYVNPNYKIEITTADASDTR